MVFEKLSLILECNADRLVQLNISLSSIDNGNIAQPQWNNSTSEDIYDIRSFVPEIHACKQRGRAQGKYNAHEVNFCQYTNSSCSLRIYFASHLQPIRVCQIGVGASHSKNNASRFRDILVQHISNLSFNIPWLVPHRDLCQSRKIDKSECKDIWRVYAEIDG